MIRSMMTQDDAIQGIVAQTRLASDSLAGGLGG